MNSWEKNPRLGRRTFILPSPDRLCTAVPGGPGGRTGGEGGTFHHPPQFESPLYFLTKRGWRREQGATLRRHRLKAPRWKNSELYPLLLGPGCGKRAAKRWAAEIGPSVMSRRAVFFFTRHLSRIRAALPDECVCVSTPRPAEGPTELRI